MDVRPLSLSVSCIKSARANLDSACPLRLSQRPTKHSLSLAKSISRPWFLPKSTTRSLSGGRSVLNKPEIDALSGSSSL